MSSGAAPTTTAPGTLRIVSYDHGGYVAWGWWKGWDGPGGVKDCIRKAVARLDRFPRLRWGFHIEGATWDWALENDPAFVKEFLRLVEKDYPGRISLASGGYGQPLSWTIGEEANVRHLVLDAEAYGRLGHRIGIYMQNEHGFFPQMPQLLRGVGIDKAILRTVWGMYGICPEIDGSKVRWRAPDGSWVEAIPTYVGGNRGLGKNAWDTRIIIGLEGPIDLEPFRGFFLGRGIRQPVAVRIDDFHLPRDGNAPGGFARLCAHSERDGFRWVSGEEAFAEIPLEETVLDTGIDDYPIQMPWGYEGNLFWNLSREAECGLLTAERLAALSASRGGAAWEGTLQRGWKALLTAQHHDINICGVSSGGEHAEFIFEVARRLYGEAITSASSVTSAVLKSMCHQMRAGSADRVVAIANPLAWARTGLVEVRIKSEKGKQIGPLAVGIGGAPVEHQLVARSTEPGGTLSFATIAFPASVGSLGMTSAEIAFLPGHQAPAGGLVRASDRVTEIRTGWGSVDIDRRTGDCAVRGRDGSPLLVSGAKNGLLSAYVDGKPCETSITELEVTADGPLFATVRLGGVLGPLPCRIEVTAFRDEPRIDFRVTVEVHGQSIGATSVPAEWDGKDEPLAQEEKLCIGFTPALSGRPRVYQDVPFTIGETGKSFINAGLWVSVSDGRRSFTLVNRGTMGFLWDGGRLRNILLYSGKYSWGERDAWLEGSYDSHLSLLFHGAGPTPALDAQRAALACSFPLAAVSGTPRTGALDPSSLGLDILDAGSGAPCPHLVLSALFTRDGVLHARLYEAVGVAATRIRMRLHGEAVSLLPVDFLGSPTGPAADVVEISSFAIRTLRLLFEGTNPAVPGPGTREGGAR